MSCALLAYDHQDFDLARERAMAVLAVDPANVRMLRLVVSVACIEGDEATARSRVKQLPEPDRKQMDVRCRRYGVVLQ